ncbi:MAG: chemotaxis protein CheW [Oceanospirillaceae bacterium]|nr:chemotaxis protein CheW [Oceanospirillaceae bacterium]MCP5350050.1 chemotaxis protein CheW [Oceanospirillaceae bacterium]
MAGPKKLVDQVVQDYLDSMLQGMLADTLGPVLQDLPPAEVAAENVTFIAKPVPRSAPIEEDPVEQQVVNAPPVVKPVIAIPVVSAPAPTVARTEPVARVETKVRVEVAPQVEISPKVEITPKVEIAPAITKTPDIAPPVGKPVAPEPAQAPVPKAEPVSSEPAKPLRYPLAPPWAQTEIDCLLFDVCGLKLAVPMEMLGRIIKLEDELNFIIGKPDWFLGVLNDQEYRLSAIDTALYIMPEKGKRLSESGYTHLLQLQRSNWTLACSKVYHTVRIHPNDVKWRSLNGKRPWLAGTVIQHMCALLQVDTLIHLLETQQDPNQ